MRTSVNLITSRQSILHIAATGAVAALLGLAVNGARAQNLLINGDFNTDADANSQPDAWSNWSYGSTSFGAYKNDPTNDPFDFDGTPYVNAGNYGDWWSSGAGWFQVVSGAENVAYSLSCVCGTEGWDNAAGEMRIIYLDSSSTELRRDVYHTAEYIANQPWTPFNLTSVAPAGTTQVKAEVATWGARGSVLWDNINLTVASVWNVDASGSWFAGGNWIGGTPNGVDAAARFLGAITSDQTIAIDSPTTLGSLGFDNAHTYVLAGAGNLTLQTSSGAVLVDVKQGAQKINLPLTIASNTQLNVATGAVLRISDPLTIGASKSLSQIGAGVVLYESSISLETGASIVFGNSTSAATLSLASAANASVAAHGTGASKILSVTGLSVASDAKLDITDNPFIVDYTGATPISSVRELLRGGQLVSSATPAAHALGYIESSKLIGPSGGIFEGQSVDGTAVLVKLTYGGDASMDGQVDVTDLGSLATNWQAAADWSGGDFNYDGVVDVTDLGILATNWQAGVAAPSCISLQDAMAAVGLGGVSVPEPAAISVLALGALAVLRRRSR